VLLVSAAVGLTAAYFALRIGFGLFASPAKNRKATEKALWLGIPGVWIAMVGANLLPTGGQNDVTVWPLVAMTGALWTAVIVSSAMCVRSRRVRAYFEEETSA
jgi:hypothetical protein